MSRINLDALDHEIIHLLNKDGRISIGGMAKQLNASSPTIRNRIKKLEQSGLFKVAGLVDPSSYPDMILAMVAMSVQSEGRIDEIMEKISNLPNVAWAGVAAGRYDIIAEVVCVGGMDELYAFTTETILEVGNVIKSETFIIMKSRGNWLHLPENTGHLKKKSLGGSS